MKKTTILDMQRLAESRGGVCLSQEYAGARTKLKWQCAGGHVWEATPEKVKGGSWCHVCARAKLAKAGKSRRLTIEQMQDIARGRGGRCLSEVYRDSRTKLRWQCENGHAWEARPYAIKQGTWCPTCGRRKTGEAQRLDISEMQEIASARGGKCLSEAYVNARTKLKWQCAEGHTWDATPAHVKHGTWCPHCAGKAKLTIKEMRQIADSRGGRCLSKLYIDAKRKLTWQCAEGHTWEAAPDHVKRGSWCPVCGRAKSAQASRSRRLTLGQMQEIARERAGRCLSKEYVSRHKKLVWKCHYGHVWHARPGNVMSGAWCPICKLRFYRSERVCRRIVEDMFGERFPKRRPSWLVNAQGNRMELDGYSKKLGVAFEYHGKQHYEHIAYLHKDKSLRQRQADDRLKRKLCKEHSILLLEIPYSTPYEDIARYVVERYDLDSSKYPLLRTDTDHSLLHTYLRTEEVDELQAIAGSRGGKYLSQTYVNARTKVRWECDKGHTWQMTPNEVRRGRWCPRCGRERIAQALRSNIGEMQEIAVTRGGKCLSKAYKNANTKLKWRCSAGHEWDATPANVKRGTWCPTCARFKREEALRLARIKTGRTRLTIEQMSSLAEVKGGKCLSTEYVDSKTKLIWQCDKGHIWHSAPQNITAGKWCPVCGRAKAAQTSRSRRLTIAQVQAIAHERGGRCLSEVYEDAHTKLAWQCAEGHVWKAQPTSVKQGSWCPVCWRAKVAQAHKSRRLTIEEMQQIAADRGGKCLSTVYENNRTKLKWQCSQGHAWEAAPNNVKHGTWCPVCSRISTRQALHTQTTS